MRWYVCLAHSKGSRNVYYSSFPRGHDLIHLPWSELSNIWTHLDSHCSCTIGLLSLSLVDFTQIKPALAGRGLLGQPVARFSDLNPATWCIHCNSRLCINHKFDQYAVHFLILIVNKYTAGVSLARLLESFGVVSSLVFTLRSDVPRKCRFFISNNWSNLPQEPPTSVCCR